MKLPRDVNGADAVQALRRLGYEKRRQTGSPSVGSTYLVAFGIIHALLPHLEKMPSPLPDEVGATGLPKHA